MFDFQHITNTLRKIFVDSDSDSSSESDNEQSHYKKTQKPTRSCVKNNEDMDPPKSDCCCVVKKPEPRCPNEMKMNHTFTKDDFENMKPSANYKEFAYPSFGRNNYGLTGRRSDYAFRTRGKYHTDRTTEYITVQCENELYSSFPSCKNDLMISGRDNY